MYAFYEISQSQRCICLLYKYGHKRLNGKAKSDSKSSAIYHDVTL